MPKTDQDSYTLTEREIKINNQLYKDFRDSYGETPEGLGWNGRREQELRFEIMLKILDIQDPLQDQTILDVGCGFADLYSYLKKKYGKIDYTGIDINPDALKIAKSRYPETEFIEANILETPMKKYDYIFCSGIFATILDDNEAFIREMIRRMVFLANKGIAFNFLQKSQFTSNLAEYDKSIILKFCKKNFKKAKMLDSYLGNDDVTIGIKNSISFPSLKNTQSSQYIIKKMS